MRTKLAQSLFTDYYQVLGVTSLATQRQIRTAYLNRAKICHPDKGGTVYEMRQLNQAYATLHQFSSRYDYDLIYHQMISSKATKIDDNEDEIDMYFRDIVMANKSIQWPRSLIFTVSAAAMAVFLFTVFSISRMVATAQGHQQISTKAPQK